MWVRRLERALCIPCRARERLKRGFRGGSVGREEEFEGLVEG